MTVAAILRSAATLAALLAAGAVHGGEPVAKRAQGSAPEPAAATAAAPERPRVAAGVLVRATSRRAQKRGAAREGTAVRAPAAGGTIESIEIDWNASGSTP